MVMPPIPVKVNRNIHMENLANCDPFWKHTHSVEKQEIYSHFKNISWKWYTAAYY